MIYAGIDEVAVSCIAGPLIAAVCILPEDHGIGELPIDSKRLSDSKIKELAGQIKEKAIFYKIVELSADKIEEFGVNFALVKLQNKLVKQLQKNNHKVKIIVDGKKKIPCIKDSELHEAIIRADSTHDNVSAAAILAKDYSNDVMLELDKLYPGYNLKKNKGYPVAAHIESIKKLGLSPIHRVSMTNEELAKKDNLNDIIENTSLDKDLLKSIMRLLSKLYNLDNTLFSEFQSKFFIGNYKKVMAEADLSPKIQYWISKILLDVSEKYCRKNQPSIRRETFRDADYADESIIDLVISFLEKAS